MVRASLGKGKDVAFDPTSPLSATGQGHPEMGNKKTKQSREDASAMERLQSSIKKCIPGVAMNYAAREEKEAAREVKFDARWDKMFEKQEVKIDLLKTNVAAIKRKDDLVLLTTDTLSMCAEVKAWHKAQCDINLAEMRPPPAAPTSTMTAASNPPEASNGATLTGGDDDDMEEMFNI
jgi:aryl carrier-like protein